MNELEQLKREVAELKAWKASLENTSKIPYSFDTAFRDRFHIDFKLEGVTTGTASTTDIDLTGNAETITVPAQPSGTLSVSFKGTTYELLVK